MAGTKNLIDGTWLKVRIYVLKNYIHKEPYSENIYWNLETGHIFSQIRILDIANLFILNFHYSLFVIKYFPSVSNISNIIIPTFQFLIHLINICKRKGQIDCKLTMMPKTDKRKGADSVCGNIEGLWKFKAYNTELFS